MVHLGRFPHTPTITPAALLAALRPGDILTHAFRGAGGMVGADGKAVPQLRDAVDRGVVFDGPVFSYAENLTKLLALGMSQREVISVTTTHAAGAIGRVGELGSLAPGRPADLSVLEWRTDQPAAVSDGFQTLEAPAALVPFGCVRCGTWFRAAALRSVALAGTAAR
jgi:dihydroorotase